MKRLASLALSVLLVSIALTSASANNAVLTSGSVPETWILEGTDGTSAEYIYPTGRPGETGYPVGWNFGGINLMDTEPGPPVPSGYFAWVLPSSVTHSG